MATLTTQDFQDIQRMIRADAALWQEFKTWGLTKQQWMNAFQAVEDWFTGAFNTTPTSSFKAALETVTGTTTGARAQAVGRIWIQWRFRSNP